MEKHEEPVSDISYKERPFRGGYLKTFSKPLTSAQEKIYLRRYQEGDPEAKRILIERNLRLVAHVAKKYQNSGEDLEDLISVGTIGLIKAINTFDHTRCARLSTYAARCIDNELLMMFRAKKKYSREISLYEPIGTDKEGNEISLLDIVESPPVDIVEQYSVREDIRFLLCALKDTLSQKEYQVICLRYGLFGIERQTQKKLQHSFISAGLMFPGLKKTPSKNSGSCLNSKKDRTLTICQCPAFFYSSDLLKRSYCSISVPRSTASFCCGCGALSTEFPSSS